MKNKIKKQSKSKKYLFIFVIILILAAIILLLTRKSENNKINNINQIALGLYTTNMGDVTNQIASTPNKPQLSAGMIPIKYENGNWIITTEDDPNWYNYEDGKMATIMLNNGKYQSEQAVNMQDKLIAQSGTLLNENEMGTTFVWIPRFAYNENNEVLYLKATSSIAGEYITSDLFTYKASGANAEDIALRGIWIEKESKLGNVTSSLNMEDNAYGIISNTKAEYMTLDSNFINSINQTNETGIANIEIGKMILKVVDEKLLEPIMAELSSNGKTVTIKITKATNGISQIKYSDGTVLEDFDGTTATYTVEKSGLNKFIIIDNIGNQRVYEINVSAIEIYVITNQEDFVEFDGKKWYPSGTQVTIKYMDDMTGIRGYYQEINGTLPTAVTWSSGSTSSYKNFTLTETMTYKAKMENSIGEVIGEGEETIYIMPKDTSIPTTYYENNVGGIYPVKVTWSSSSGSYRYGTETYKYDTYIRDAAKHMGLIQKDESKVLYIKIVPSPQGGYIGSSRNGVTSSNYSNNFNGYTFVSKDGQEILLPKINNISSKVENNKITVTVDAKTTNPKAEIVKYYYSIDNTNTITDLNTAINNLDTEMTTTNYKESDSNVFTFENVKPYQNHNIRVFVKDNYGSVGVLSEIYEETVKVTSELEKPTIRILKPNTDQEFEEDDPEIVKYDGKTWYPAGTIIEVKYSESLTSAEMKTFGLTGYYEYILDTTGEITSSSDGSNQVYTHTVKESATYKFKLKDNIDEESEEVSIHLNVMPSEYYSSYAIAKNYVNNVGAIYPVRVTGDSIIRTTEWDTRYSSRNRYIYM